MIKELSWRVRWLHLNSFWPNNWTNRSVEKKLIRILHFRRNARNKFNLIKLIFEIKS